MARCAFAPGLWMKRALVGYPHDDLAKVAALQQADQCSGRLLQSIDQILLQQDASISNPLRHLAAERGEAVRIVIKDDEALHANALLQQGGE